MKRFNFGAVFTASILACIFFLSTSTVWACDPDAVSVTTYGANGQDSLGDSAAIQLAFDDANVSKLCFPAGTFIFDAPTEISRSNLTVQGQWESTILKLVTGPDITMISIPTKNGNNAPASIYPENLIFERFIMDGAHNIEESEADPNFFGIFLQQGKNITFRDIIFRDFWFEGLAVGNGNAVNKFITIERVQVQKPRRNGIHIGDCEDCIIRHTFLNNAQDPNSWEPTAGNAIDFEGESNNVPSVLNRLSVEYTLLDKEILNTASYGINLQPGMGQMTNVTINNNVGVHSNFWSQGHPTLTVDGLTLTNNWFSNPSPGINSFAVMLFNTFNVKMTGNRLHVAESMKAIHLQNVDGINNNPVISDADNHFFRTPAPYFNEYQAGFFAYYENGTTGLSNIYMPGTVDTGNSATRICTGTFGVLNCPSQMPGTNINIGFIQSNEDPTTFQSPQINSFVVYPNRALIKVTDPQNKKMRAMLLQNGFPIALKDVDNYGLVSFNLLKKRSSTDGFEVRVYDEAGKRAISSVFQTGVEHDPFDFDGDGKSDLSVFRPSNATWYFDRSTSGFLAAPFGISTDKLAPADYDGDGKADYAVFRNGAWFIERSTSGYLAASLGTSGDIPVPQDFSGDGKADLAVFRPSTGVWYVLNLVNSQSGSLSFGSPGDDPLIGDFDGDGKADYAVFRASNNTWYLQQSAAGFAAIGFGLSGDIPVPADYDGDGKTDVAVYRSGVWHIQRSSLGYVSYSFGLSSDVPTPTDYDGDGKADISVFRNGNWYRTNSSDGAFVSLSFGGSGDIPVPAFNIVQ